LSREALLGGPDVPPRDVPEVTGLPLLASLLLRCKIVPTQHLLDMVIGVHVLHESRDGRGNFSGDVSSIVLIVGAVLRPRVGVCLTWTKASEMDTKSPLTASIATQNTNLGLQ
jgi:hypothetical protein